MYKKGGEINNQTVTKKRSTGPDRARNIVNNARTLFILLPSPDEFHQEYELLRTIIIPEMYTYCCDRDIDLECAIFFASDMDYIQLNFLLTSIEKANASILVFVGDKYGNYVIPFTLSEEEYVAIQAAAIEFSKDVNLLSQCYIQLKSKYSSEYRLKEYKAANRPAVVELIQESLNRAKEDGNLQRISEKRQSQFFYSYLETVVSAMLDNSPANHIFVVRSFTGCDTSAPNDAWLEDPGKKQDALIALKEKITPKSQENNRPPDNRLSFLNDVSSRPPSQWFASRDGERYKKELYDKTLATLKNVLNIPENISISSSSYSVTPLEVALREQATHERFVLDYAPKYWCSRETIDARISAIIDQGMNKSTFYQFYGPTGCGKTAIIHRFLDLLSKREGCYVYARFSGITDTCVFANELFKNLLLKICEAARIAPSSMAGSFHLSEILAHFKALSERITQPIFILIDDAHLIRSGKTMSLMDKPLRKLFPRLSIILTANTAQCVIPAFSPPEMVELPQLNRDQIMDILKHQGANQNQKLGSEMLTLIRHKIKKADGNVILGEILYEEAAITGTEPSNTLDDHLNKIESMVGVDAVRIVCQLLLSLPYGLTMIEIADGFRLCQHKSGEYYDREDLPLTSLPYIVIHHLGRLLINIYNDRRKVWSIAHTEVAVLMRQRYYTSPLDMKFINEVMSEMYSVPSSMEDENKFLFPQPINRENGTVNLRRVRYQWYFFLHTGDIDKLKEYTLCYFYYIEACFRGTGLGHLLSVYEQCSQQVLDHDILVLFEQILLPAIPTLIRDREQLDCEMLNRLRFSSNKNSDRLNNMVDQLMTFADTYSRAPLLLPLTCWLRAPKMKQIVSFNVANWKSGKTVLEPTFNHQHLLVTGNELETGIITMYHIASTLPVRNFVGHTQRVTAMRCSHDGQFFVSVSLDGTARVWSFTQQGTPNPMNQVFTVTKAKLMCLLITNDDKHIVTGATDSTARLMDLETGETLKSFKDHTGPVVDVQMSSDNTLLVTGSGDFVVMVWDVNDCEIILRMSGLMAPVTCLAITSNDAFLAVACEDETLRVFSMVSAQELHELTGHEARINALAASGDDCQLFAATKGKVLCYDIHNGQLLETLECTAQQPVISLKISNDNSFVFAGCGENIHLWNMNSIERTAPRHEKSKLTCVKLALDERSAACGTIDGIVAFWDLDLCRCLWSTTQQKSGTVTALEFTFDSMFILSGSILGTVMIWEASNGYLLRTFSIHDSEVNSICCFGDGFRVMSCDTASKFNIWSFPFTDEINNIEIHVTTYGIRGPLYLGCHDNVLIGYNAKNPKEMNIWSIMENKLVIKTKVYHNENILCYCANKAGKVLVTGSMDQSLKIWQIDTGFLTQVLVGHEDVVTCCCVSEDSQVVVSGGQDKHIYIWDVGTGAVRRSITARSIINFVRITNDNSVIISTDQDGWIEAWSSETSRMYSSFNTHRQIGDIVVSTDASRILVLLNETAQFPILCLHNTPANMSIRHERQRTNRIHSSSSSGSENIELLEEHDTPAQKASIIVDMNLAPNAQSQAQTSQNSTNVQKKEYNSQTLAPKGKSSFNAHVSVSAPVSTVNANSKSPPVPTKTRSTMCSII